MLGKSIVRYPKSGGLILAAKPEDLAMWKKIFESARRKDDLLVFSAESPLRFNFLDYELRHGGHTRNIARCITTIAETLRSTDNKGGEEGHFWEDNQFRLLGNGVEVMKQATGRVSAPELQQFISGAAMSPGQIATDEWRTGFHNRCLEQGFNKAKSSIEQHDYQLALDYWLTEYPSMPEKTRGSIVTGVMQILYVFNSGIVRSLCSDTTNVSPDNILAGKWVFVDFSVGMA